MNIAYNVDCMIAMKEMEDNFFDLAVVDPPYGIGMDGGNVGYKGANNFEKKGWDTAPPPKEYFLELFRVSKNQIIFGGNYFNLPPTRCFVIWDKGAGFRGRSYAEAELAWTSFDRNTRIYTRDPLCNGDYKGKIHPTQKPVALYSWIFSKFAKPGEKILDTHLGSGSSRIAAYEANLDFVGFEIDREYFEAQEKRYCDYVSQLSMFSRGGGVVVIYAIDFDGTLCVDHYPEIGEPREDMISAVLDAQRAGDRFILWTCRVGERLEEAVAWSAAQGIIFDAVNDNLPDMIALYGNNCRKVFADGYIDDRNVRDLLGVEI